MVLFVPLFVVKFYVHVIIILFFANIAPMPLRRVSPYIPFFCSQNKLSLITATQHRR